MNKVYFGYKNRGGYTMRKRFFKKALALTLASTMAFSMVGCGSSSKDSSEGKK